MSRAGLAGFEKAVQEAPEKSLMSTAEVVMRQVFNLLKLLYGLSIPSELQLLATYGPITSTEPILSCLLRLCLWECVSKI